MIKPAATERTEVLFNADCPICNWEVGVYKKHAPPDLEFVPITAARARDLGLSMDEAARALHLRRGGQRVAGVAAFLDLWAHIPRYRLLARVLSWPPLRLLAEIAYRYGAAPALYALHKRRQAKRGQGR